MARIFSGGRIDTVAATPASPAARVFVTSGAAASAGVEETWAGGRHSAGFEVFAVAEQVCDAADVGLLVGQHERGPAAERPVRPTRCT
jgi:hypothetical protein